MNTPLTEAERAIIMALAEVWNSYVALPEQHPMAQKEFCEGIHRLQEHVAARPTFRQLKEESSG